MRLFKERVFYIVVLCLLTGLAFYPVLFQGKVALHSGFLESQAPWFSHSQLASPGSIETDSQKIFYPWHVLLKEAFTKGEFPLWNPFAFSGAPFLANGQASVLDPLNLLTFFLPPYLSFTYIQMIQYLLGGLFTFLFLSRLGLRRSAALLGAALFIFNPLFRMTSVFKIYVGTMYLTPLGLYFADRIAHRKKHSKKYFDWLHVAIALVFALQLVGGIPEIVLYSMALTFSYLLWKRGFFSKQSSGGFSKKQVFLTSLIPFVLAFLWAAPQVLPLLELSTVSNRMKLFFAGPVRTFPAWHLLTLLQPRLFGDGTAAGFYDAWGVLAHPAWVPKLLHLTSYYPSHFHILYFGIPGFFLALWTVFFRKEILNARFFIFAALGSLVWAMAGRFYSLVFYFIPVLNKIETPERMIFVAETCLIYLAAFGFDHVLGCIDLLWKKNLPSYLKKGLKKYSIAVGLSLLVSIASFFILCAWVKSLNAVHRDAWTFFRFSNPVFWTPVLFAVLFFSLFYLYGSLQRKMPRYSLRIIEVLVLTLVIADLFVILKPWRVFSERKIYEQHFASVDFLKKNAGSGSLFRASALQEKRALSIFEPNLLATSFIHDARGFDSLYPKWSHEFGRTLMNTSPDDPAQTCTAYEDSPRTLLQLAGVRFKATSAFLSDHELVFENHQMRIYADEKTPGRIYLPRSTQRLDDREKVFQVFSSPEFHPEKVAITTGSECNVPSGDENTKPVKIQHFQESFNSLSATIETQRPGLLVIADTYFPGWKATLNSTPVSIHRTNWAFRGVCIEKPGKYELEMKYDPLSFKAGKTISGIAFLGVFAYLLFL